MKKLLLLPILLTSLLLAREYTYEITPIVGYNITQGNTGLNNYGIVGSQLQYNGLNSFLSPELSIIYSKANYTFSHTQNTKVYRIALNGVYDFEQMGPVIPLLKAGIAYEDIKHSSKGNSPFIDLAIGAKIPFNDTIALKLEAMYMFNYNNAVKRNKRDNNLALLAGLNIAFGEKAKKEAPKTFTPMNKVIPTQVLVSPKIIHTPKVKKIDGDDDKDGVVNSIDKCSQTPLGKLVYKDGCPESLNLNVHFSNDSARIDIESYERIKSYAKFLKEHATYSTDIIGYTSNTGTEQHNEKLSLDRATAVQKMLIDEGVPFLKVRALGRGSQNPIASNDTVEGRATNRRIEAEITKDK